MLKTEMTWAQLESRASFVKQLTEAEWDTQGWEMLFAANHRMSPEAQAEYQNAAFSLRLSYFVEDEYLLLEAVGKVGLTVLALRLYPSGEVGAVVDQVIAAQETLDEENYLVFIEKLKPVCRLIAFETGDKLVEIK